RAMRRRVNGTDAVTYSAADPMNLVGVVIPGDREAAIPGRTVTHPGAKVEVPAEVHVGMLPLTQPQEGGALA
ncbi:MAG: hypothetical protein ACRD3F_02690, partial [Acidobacteriaceae bacterium]